MPRLTRAVASLACLLLVSGSVLGMMAAPASAASTLLCKGYAGCAGLDMSNAGYKAASGTMWWRMYAGHNCTNYAAYRMVRSGMSKTRPWSGGGNASNWGLANKSLTDAVPAVGAVAWWGANVRPAGSAGHVAYVERVVSADEIVVSQDSWGGDFSWARITRAGGSWPSGFVHFNDVPMKNTTKPTVAGLAKVGARLTATPGKWSVAGAAIHYQWLADGAKIPKATRPTLDLQPGQEDKRISVRTTASEVGYPTTAVTSAKTPAVAPGVITNTGAPMITGEPKVDSPLTASTGTWKPAPDLLTFQWSADGVPIDGATDPTFTPDADVVAKTLSVTVTASKDGYDDVPALSQATTPVARGTFTVSDPATVTGSPRRGQTLTFHPADFAPGDAEVSLHWLRSGVPIDGHTRSTYRLTAADLGYRIAVRMTVTKPGYTTLVTRTHATSRVKSVPRLKLVTRPGRHRLGLTVSLSARGVTRVTGTVLVKSHGKLLKTLTLRKGTRTTTLRGLPKGSRTFVVRYTGSSTVTSAVVKRTVHIR